MVKRGWRYSCFEDRLAESVDLIVDALLGTGLRKRPANPLAS
ncbi:hypothetical protein ACLK19_28190 [Escherichia coli]